MDMAGADHPNGAVAFVDSLEAQQGILKDLISTISRSRGVLLYTDADDAKKALLKLPDGSVVCVVAPRVPAKELAPFLRSNDRGQLLRSVPLLVLTRLPQVAAVAAKVGSVVETNKERWAQRILSLPSKKVINSESSACLFKGLLTDLQYGHFKDEAESKDYAMAETRERMLDGLCKQRLHWYPHCEGYHEHLEKLAPYFSGLQPVHRFKPSVFLAALQSGVLMSKVELEASRDMKMEDFVRSFLPRHLTMRELCRRFSRNQKRTLWQYAVEYCMADEHADEEITKGSRAQYEGKTGIVTFGPDSDGDCMIKYDKEAKTSGYIHKSKLTKIVNREAAEAARKSAEHLRNSLPKDCLATIDAGLVQVSKDLRSVARCKLEGIGYSKDEALGTNRHVFATWGVNNGFGYGSVVVLLKQDVLYNPDSWLTPLAATGFMSPYYWVFHQRPWTGAALVELAKPDMPKVYDDAPSKPEDDHKGIMACVHSAVNLGAVEDWPLLIARDVDAMCHYLSFDHREAYAFDDASDGKGGHGKDWRKEDVRKQARKKLLNPAKSQVLPDAASAVVDYYETKDSHTAYEFHGPSKIPLGAIETIILAKGLLEDRSDIKDKVENFMMPDGRRLRDIVVTTKSAKACMEWQHNHFKKRQEEHANLRRTAGTDKVDMRRSHPISVQVEALRGRPVFLPVDFGAWFESSAAKPTRSKRVLQISFCSRVAHDLRIYFSTTAEPQRPNSNLRDARWKTTTYTICIGSCGNTQSYITKGLLGTQHSVHVADDPLARCTGSPTTAIWERYWFQAKQDGAATVVTCGRGPFGHNEMLRFEDKENPIPFARLRYIGLGCWNEPTVYCDLTSGQPEVTATPSSSGIKSLTGMLLGGCLHPGRT